MARLVALSEIARWRASLWACAAQLASKALTKSCEVAGLDAGLAHPAPVLARGALDVPARRVHRTAGRGRGRSGVAVR